MPAINCTLNGNHCTFEVEAKTTLINVLRNLFNLKSVKYGCGMEDCGACKVIVNDKAVFACTLEAAGLDGADIVTLNLDCAVFRIGFCK